MPLIAPILDQRSYDDLVRELRQRIQRYTPEWTDYNDSDPGMTLLQLFAWLSEQLLFQMNQVPELNYTKFLQLLGMDLRPAAPARALLTFVPQPGFSPPPGSDVASVPRHARIAAQPPDGGPQAIFETCAGLDLIRAPLTAVQVFDGAAFHRVTAANTIDSPAFRPFGWVPQLGSALYLGFSPEPAPTAGRVFPQQMRLYVFLPPDLVARRGQLAAEAATPASVPARLVWEYRPDGAGDGALAWQPLTVYEDQSAAFTREGQIVIEGPANIALTAEGQQLQGAEERRYWLRCRVASGAYPASRPPEIVSIRPNVVPAEHLTTVRHQLVGTSNGAPDQCFPLQHAPVLAGSLRLEVSQPAYAPPTPPEWVQVSDLLASRGDDRHYTLQASTGVICFGDGCNGDIPPDGAEIIAREYRYGGGARGNVAALQIRTPLDALPGVAQVFNERPAAGGVDEQCIEDLKDEAPRRLRARGRAVTPDDFEALAQDIGGVARAKALPQAHPDYPYPEVEVPGAVTVVVVPASEANPPTPGPELLAAVGARLEQVRLLTTEVYVKGPTYRKVQVSAVVAAMPYVQASTVIARVGERLDAYLNPVGRAAAGAQPGWEFGEDLHPANLYKVILDAEDVRQVKHLALFVDGCPHSIRDDVRVPADGLIYGADHQIEVVPWKPT